MPQRHEPTALIAVLIVAALLAAPARSQTPPDAGQVLRENTPAPIQPRPREKLELTQPPLSTSPEEVGASAQVNTVILIGNTVFRTAILEKQLGDYRGRRYTLAQLRTLANQIAAFYRLHRYPFTRVILPPQDLSGGELRIQILEGRYGRVTSGNKNPKLDRGATPFLSALKTGNLIEGHLLERVVLIVDDQPGMKALPTIRPGEATGTGDFAANVRRVARFGGDIGADNAGNRYVGEYRGTFNAYAFSPFMFGDQITLRGLYSGLGMQLGSIEYERPLGGSGLRGDVSLTQTDYQLGDQFKSLDASGYARVFDARVKYPIIRSQNLNLTFVGGAEYEQLEDKFGTAGVIDHKWSLSLPVTLQFDEHDRIFGGGVTYGAIGLLHGVLRLNPELNQVDAATARTAGAFTRLNLDISRVQNLIGHSSLFAHVLAQWSNKNLDSSEKFVLGGYYGVRGYPVGEGLSDRGWLLQSEARYAFQAFKPYALFDVGEAWPNAKPWDSASQGHRDLASAGLGARLNYRHWFLDGSLAWQVSGGPATSDRKNINPHPWINIDYKF